jgi:hypothetical protein
MSLGFHKAKIFCVNIWLHAFFPETYRRKKMFKRRFLILIGILVLLMAVVPQVFAQEVISPFFQRLSVLAREHTPKTGVTYLPLMLDELMAQGIIVLNDPEVKETAAAYEEFKAGAQQIIEVADHLASYEEVSFGALRVYRFMQTILTLADQTNQLIALGQAEPQNVIQILNPEFITWWAPQPDGPRDIEEKVFTAEIPIWGAAVIVKEVRGVKLHFVKGRLPINPCWWDRVGLNVAVHPDWRIWHLQLVPAEFIKSISYVNKWNSEKRQPEVIKKVEKDVILDNELMHFWLFLSDPKAAPENVDNNSPNMGSSQVKREAVVWGNLKRSR